MYEEITESFKEYTDGIFILVNNRTKVSISTFINRFSGCDLTYESLVSKDDGKLGYITFFDELKQKGILN